MIFEIHSIYQGTTEEESSLILKSGDLCNTVQNDSSTIASTMNLKETCKDKELRVPEEKTKYSEQLSRMNYFCYVEGCKCSFKYLYRFKYHMAGHSIFHFDCTICKKRFDKYLEFKKHFKFHRMSINDYKVERSKVFVLPKDFPKGTCHRRISPHNFHQQNGSLNKSISEKAAMEELFAELVTLLGSQTKCQESDYSRFDPTIVMFKQSGFPSFNACLRKI